MNWGLDTNYDQTGLRPGFKLWIERLVTRINNKSMFVPDDYRTGAWTPSLGGNTTYTLQQGVYTKIGCLVNIHCRLTINVIGTGSTGTVSGLPFTSTYTTAGVVAYWGTAAATYVFLACNTSAGATTVAFDGLTAAGGTVAAAMPFQNGTDILFNVSYITSS